ncbi:MAG: MBL fold metallo-hydrolase [Pseudomonadota bacterium]
MSKQTPILSRRSALIAGTGLIAAPAILGRATTPAHAAAPMLGATMPEMYRFTLGDFEITTIKDGAIQLDGPHPIFGQNVEAADVQALAEENFLPATTMEIAFTPVVVNTGESLVVFDAGNGAARRPNAGKLGALLEAAGYTLDQVDVVVLTHMHPDHIGGLMEDGAPLFPNARYVTGQAEYDFWSAEERLSGPTERVGTLVQSNVVPLAEKMSFVGDEGEVVPGIRAMACFGHTPGHMAYHVESAGKRFLLWADLTNHYVVSLQRPDWHVRFDMDKEAAAASRKRILDMVSADRIPASGYHMPFPAVGFVEQTSTSYRWVPVSYGAVQL